jgi:hypothetical protein
MFRKMALVSMILFSVSFLCGFAHAAEKKEKAAIKTGNIVYVCDCGEGCQCNTLSKKSGKCTCGKKLVQMHVLKIEGTEAILCKCGKGCTCAINPADPTKCGCGQPVKRVSLKGKYVCACGDACECNTISDKPGKCTCGKALKKIE